MTSKVNHADDLQEQIKSFKRRRSSLISTSAQQLAKWLAELAKMPPSSPEFAASNDDDDDDSFTAIKPQGGQQQAQKLNAFFELRKQNALDKTTTTTTATNCHHTSGDHLSEQQHHSNGDNLSALSASSSLLSQLLNSSLNQLIEIDNGSSVVSVCCANSGTLKAPKSPNLCCPFDTCTPFDDSSHLLLLSDRDQRHPPVDERDLLVTCRPPTKLRLGSARLRPSSGSSSCNENDLNESNSTNSTNFDNFERLRRQILAKKNKLKKTKAREESRLCRRSTDAENDRLFTFNDNPSALTATATTREAAKRRKRGDQLSEQIGSLIRATQQTATSCQGDLDGRRSRSHLKECCNNSPTCDSASSSNNNNQSDSLMNRRRRTRRPRNDEDQLTSPVGFPRGPAGLADKYSICGRDDVEEVAELERRAYSSSPSGETTTTAAQNGRLCGRRDSASANENNNSTVGLISSGAKHDEVEKNVVSDKLRCTREEFGLQCGLKWRQDEQQHGPSEATKDDDDDGGGEATKTSTFANELNDRDSQLSNSLAFSNSTLSPLSCNVSCGSSAGKSTQSSENSSSSSSSSSSECAIQVTTDSSDCSSSAAAKAGASSANCQLINRSSFKPTSHSVARPNVAHLQNPSGEDDHAERYEHKRTTMGLVKSIPIKRTSTTTVSETKYDFNLDREDIGELRFSHLDENNNNNKSIELCKSIVESREAQHHQQQQILLLPIRRIQLNAPDKLRSKWASSAGESEAIFSLDPSQELAERSSMVEATASLARVVLGSSRDSSRPSSRVSGLHDIRLSPSCSPAVAAAKLNNRQPVEPIYDVPSQISSMAVRQNERIVRCLSPDDKYPTMRTTTKANREEQSKHQIKPKSSQTANNNDLKLVKLTETATFPNKNNNSGLIINDKRNLLSRQSSSKQALNGSSSAPNDDDDDHHDENYVYLNSHADGRHSHSRRQHNHSRHRHHHHHHRRRPRRPSRSIWSPTRGQPSGQTNDINNNDNERTTTTSGCSASYLCSLCCFNSKTTSDSNSPGSLSSIVYIECKRQKRPLGRHKGKSDLIMSSRQHDDDDDEGQSAATCSLCCCSLSLSSSSSVLGRQVDCDCQLGKINRRLGRPGDLQTNEGRHSSSCSSSSPGSLSQAYLRRHRRRGRVGRPRPSARRRCRCGHSMSPSSSSSAASVEFIRRRRRRHARSHGGHAGRLSALRQPSSPAARHLRARSRRRHSTARWRPAQLAASPSGGRENYGLVDEDCAGVVLKSLINGQVHATATSGWQPRPADRAANRNGNDARRAVARPGRGFRLNDRHQLGELNELDELELADQQDGGEETNRCDVVGGAGQSGQLDANDDDELRPSQIGQHNAKDHQRRQRRHHHSNNYATRAPDRKLISSTFLLGQRGQPVNSNKTYLIEDAKEHRKHSSHGRHERRGERHCRLCCPKCSYKWSRHRAEWKPTSSIKRRQRRRRRLQLKSDTKLVRANPADGERRQVRAKQAARRTRRRRRRRSRWGSAGGGATSSCTCCFSVAGSLVTTLSRSVHLTGKANAGRRSIRRRRRRRRVDRRLPVDQDEHRQHSRHCHRVADFELGNRRCSCSRCRDYLVAELARQKAKSNATRRLIGGGQRATVGQVRFMQRALGGQLNKPIRLISREAPLDADDGRDTKNAQDWRPTNRCQCFHCCLVEKFIIRDAQLRRERKQAKKQPR